MSDSVVMGQPPEGKGRTRRHRPRLWPMVRVRVDQRWAGASGKTGSRVRFQVELATPAHDAYQASAAVIRPSQPPSW